MEGHMEFQSQPGRIFAEDEAGELLCEITFPDDGVVANIDHTFVSDRLRGQGVAGMLMSAAMEQIKERGLKAYPTCSYAVKWAEKNPEAMK